jgi:C1A family cysteine protease
VPNVYGRLPRTRDPRDFRARAPRPYTGAYVNLENRFPPPGDQLDLGSCVSWGCTTAAAYAHAIAGRGWMDPSELFTYYAARARAGYDTRQDTGLEIRDGFASLAKDGVAPERDWPYEVANFAIEPPATAYLDAADMEAVVYGVVPDDGVDNTISSGYPVVIGFDVFESFEDQDTADSGVMPMPQTTEQIKGGHCVMLVSTPKPGSEIAGALPELRYRRARNSWGTGWGDGGWFWFPVPAMTYASDFWQVTSVSDPTPPVPPEPLPDPAAAPSPEARELARVLRGSHNWVDGWHYGHAGKVARAARPWLESEGL